jgi:hypothetical protein
VITPPPSPFYYSDMPESNRTSISISGVIMAKGGFTEKEIEENTSMVVLPLLYS